LSRQNQALWTVSLLTAAALTVSGEHAKNAAEVIHREAGLYRQMPGIIVGLFGGFILDSPVVVFVATVAVNATVYYFALRGAMWLWTKPRKK
jgi:hypothetical protein